MKMALNITLFETRNALKIEKNFKDEKQQG